MTSASNQTFRDPGFRAFTATWPWTIGGGTALAVSGIPAFMAAAGVTLSPITVAGAIGGAVIGAAVGAALGYKKDGLGGAFFGALFGAVAGAVTGTGLAVAISTGLALGLGAGVAAGAEAAYSVFGLSTGAVLLCGMIGGGTLAILLAKAYSKIVTASSRLKFAVRRESRPRVIVRPAPQQ